jgi:predicted ATP-binding protein involved in virulence
LGNFLAHQRLNMIKLSQLVLKNIGPYQEQTFDFSIQTGHPDIHILTGANGTGKTTILHALASAFDYFEKDHKEHLSNNFYKRFHFFEEDENDISKSYANITIHNHHKIIDKIHCYGCEHCGHIHQSYAKILKNDFVLSRKDLHRDFPKSDDLIYYKSSLVAKNLINKHLHFAAFAYSGYRFIKSQQIILDDNKKFNPLHLSLEFIKEKNAALQFSNWVISRFSKAAIEETLGNKLTADTYRTALNLFIKSINDLTGNEYTIKIETNPWKVGIMYNEKMLEFDVLPDGLRSVLSWLGDLLMRLDEIPWENKNIPITEQNIILFLDEIEVHLHPTWQYKILPLVKQLLPNAQIFVSTHSPFIINSIDNAKIYILENKNGMAQLKETILSNTGHSYNYVYDNILNTKNIFADSTMQDIARFNALDAEIVQKNYTNELEFKTIVQRLASEEGEEVMAMISSKLFRLKRITGKDYLNGENN